MTTPPRMSIEGSLPTEPYTEPERPAPKTAQQRRTDTIKANLAAKVRRKIK